MHFCKCGHLFNDHAISPEGPEKGLVCTACECKHYDFDCIAPAALFSKNFNEPSPETGQKDEAQCP